MDADDLLAKLSQEKDRRGSKPRCHWITHGSRGEIASRLSAMIKPWGLVREYDSWMPKGFEDVAEAELHKASGLVAEHLREALAAWWLVSSRNARTPTFDIASTCLVGESDDRKPGLLLVEAKAHHTELETGGKKLKAGASVGSQQNHERIASAIEDANRGLAAATGLRWALSRDEHYQLSNRFAWSWKIASLGVPVVMVYLGFIDAAEMSAPIGSPEDWSAAVRAYGEGLLPGNVWNELSDIGGTALVPIIRSTRVALDRPVAGTLSFF